MQHGGGLGTTDTLSSAPVLTRDAVGRAGAHQPAGKLVQVCLPQEDAACRSAHAASHVMACAKAWAGGPNCAAGPLCQSSGGGNTNTRGPRLAVPSTRPIPNTALSTAGRKCKTRDRRLPPPASNSGFTARACSAAAYSNAGHAAVVGHPATSILSFTANGMPHRGPRCSAGRLSRNLQAAGRPGSTSVRHQRAENEQGTRWLLMPSRQRLPG